VNAPPIFRSKDGLGVGVPSIPQLDRDGRVRIGPDGKRAYQAAISFETTEARERRRAKKSPRGEGP
jgi:hypothetical protein